MSLWARLTWQVPHPAAHAADLARRLGVPAVPGGLVPGAWIVALGDTELEIRPWQREGPRDRPRAGGRLVFEPHSGAEPGTAAADAPMALVGVAWSTVELDRAEAELDTWLTTSEPGGQPSDGEEPHLGARTRPRAVSGLPGGTLVLEEPSTEGRLAASLARDGEGPCALYIRPVIGLDAWLAPARRTRVVARTARVLHGPLGASVLLPGAPVAGPFILVVDGTPAQSALSEAGTIEP